MVLGIMLFFSFVVAPVTFTVLDEENSRKFIRKIFPYYYNVNLVISLLILFFYVILKTFSLNFYLILAVVILFALSSYILMPLINKYKDQNIEFLGELQNSKVIEIMEKAIGGNYKDLGVAYADAIQDLLLTDRERSLLANLAIAYEIKEDRLAVIEEKYRDSLSKDSETAIRIQESE